MAKPKITEKAKTKSTQPFNQPLVSQSLNSTMSASEIATAVSEATKDLFHSMLKDNAVFNQQLLEQHLLSLQKQEESKSHLRIRNSVSTPQFGGDITDDVNLFLEQFDKIAVATKWSDIDKNTMLRQSLKDYALSWYNSNPAFKTKLYKDVVDALRANYHNDSTRYRYEQQFRSHNQQATESVTSYYAAKMDICRRLNIGESQKLRTLSSGLRPELEEYVRLQRPKDTEEAFSHATLKESIPSSNGLNQETLAKALQQAIAANAATKPTVATIDNATNQNFTTKEDVIAIIQSKNRQPQGHPGQNFSPPQGRPYNAANYRNHRTFDARPVCNSCRKRGHTMNSCYQFQRSHNQGPQNQFRPTQYGNEGYSGYPRIPRP